MCPRELYKLHNCSNDLFNMVHMIPFLLPNVILTVDNQTHLNKIFNSAVRMPFNLRLNPNERFDLSIKPVRHELKFSIWWYK